MVTSTTVVAGSSDAVMTGNVSDDVTVTRFGHSVEQVMGVVVMQSRDAWWVIWRTSWTLMVEEKTPGRTASSGATSAEAATIADSSVPETAARQVVSWLVWSTARAVVDVAVVVAGEAAGSTREVAANSDLMLSSCADSCARNHSICSSAVTASHSGG